MKYLCVILILVFSFSCKQEQVSPPLDSSQVNEEIYFKVEGIEPDDFDIVTSGDTTYYLKQLLNDIDGRRIVFDSSNCMIDSIRVKYAFGFLQMTIDDDPASTIDYVKESNWKHLNWKNGAVLLPDFYGNSSHVKVHTLLDHTNMNSLEHHIANQDFEALRKSSMSEQKRVYSDILSNQQDYIKCCPEYLDQANAFLKKSLEDFKSYSDLGIELYLASSTIEVKGKTINGKPISRWIVCK